MVKSEQQIDDIVISQVNDDAAWEQPVHVKRAGAENLSLSPALATRAAFFASLHREISVGAWLERIIQERLDLEEAAFVDLKRELAARRHPSRQDL